jgi:hypothetical protein
MPVTCRAQSGAWQARMLRAASTATASSTGTYRLADPEPGQVQACTNLLAGRGLVKPEILAPAGGWPQLKAAVENGASCVYFGCTMFNARARCLPSDTQLPMHSMAACKPCLSLQGKQL